VTAACGAGPEFTNNGGGCMCESVNGLVIRPQNAYRDWGGGGATSSAGESAAYWCSCNHGCFILGPHCYPAAPSQTLTPFIFK
jgi:hypothetical protein